MIFHFSVRFTNDQNSKRNKQDFDFIFTTSGSRWFSISFSVNVLRLRLVFRLSDDNGMLVIHIQRLPYICGGPSSIQIGEIFCTMRATVCVRHFATDEIARKNKDGVCTVEYR